MENIIKKDSPEARLLLKKADMLEAAATIMHGSAYVPSYQAVRILRRLAQLRTYPQTLDPEAVRSLAAELRKFSSTVARPASDRMTDVALTLEQLTTVAA